MANSDKNIIITPNIGSSTDDPKIVFSGANSAISSQNITVRMYPTLNGTLSFEGGAGQLFSISNTFSGTIYSVNDVSGIPSIEVLDTGLVKLGQYSGNVLIGTGTTDGVNKLQVTGGANVYGTVTATNFSGPGTSLTGTAASLTAGYATYAGYVTNSHTAGTGLSGTAYNGSAAQTWTLAASGVAAGSYTTTNLTVDTYGRITSASNGSAATSPNGLHGMYVDINGNLNYDYYSTSSAPTMNLNTYSVTFIGTSSSMLNYVSANGQLQLILSS